MKKKQITSTPNRFYYPWLRFIVSFLYRYGTYRIGGLAIALIVLIAIGSLVTKDGLLIVLGILYFLLLFLGKKWMAQQENKQ
jgi:hypothetical protein